MELPELQAAQKMNQGRRQRQKPGAPEWNTLEMWGFCAEQIRPLRFDLFVELAASKEKAIAHLHALTPPLAAVSNASYSPPLAPAVSPPPAAPATSTGPVVLAPPTTPLPAGQPAAALAAKPAGDIKKKRNKYKPVPKKMCARGHEQPNNRCKTCSQCGLNV